MKDRSRLVAILLAPIPMSSRGSFGGAGSGIDIYQELTNNISYRSGYLKILDKRSAKSCNIISVALITHVCTGCPKS
jgi:hypothetical protein